MSAVVFGGSGFIGTRLVNDLAGRQTPTLSVDIAPERQRVANAAYAVGDVRAPLDPALGKGAKAIYNLAAVHRTPGHPPQEYYDTNVRGALNVTALAEACDIRTIVFTSSISVYGPSEEIIDESSPLRPVSDYGRSKMMAETIHRQWQARSPDRRLIVVRPGVVFGPGEDGNYTQLSKALKRGLFAYPGRKTTIKSGGYVGELVNAVRFAVEKGERETTFNFAYPDASTTEDIVRAFGEVAGFRDTYPVIPIPLMLAAATPFEVLNAFGIRNRIHRDRIWKLVQSTRIAPTWLLKNGYRFETDLRSALSQWRDETDGAFT